MKNLLRCPFCGDKNILGEINSDGDVVVKRYPGAFTIIESKQIKIKCGKCKELIYFKE